MNFKALFSRSERLNSLRLRISPGAVTLARRAARLITTYERQAWRLFLVFQVGIVLTGGGALLHGLDARLQAETNMPIVIAPDPLNCVAIGSGRCLEEPDYFELLKTTQTR